MTRQRGTTTSTSRSAAPAPARRHPAFLYSTFDFIRRHVHGFWPALFAFLALGFIAGAVLVLGLAAIARTVGLGFLQRADERALLWIAGHRTPFLDEAMIQLTTLGDAIVIAMILAIACAFLWLTKHRWSVALLAGGVIGGQFLNVGLKLAFNRTRPGVVDAIDHVRTASFPSGHAMTAIIAYGTVAYLVGRLEPTLAMRRATWAFTAFVVLGVGLSRMYLGVHYPSDVLAGFIAGLVWIAFVAATLEAVRYFAPRRPETAREEHDLQQ